MALILGIGQGLFAVALLWLAALIIISLFKAHRKRSLISFITITTVSLITLGLAVAPRVSDTSSFDVLVTNFAYVAPTGI